MDKETSAGVLGLAHPSRSTAQPGANGPRLAANNRPPFNKRAGRVEAHLPHTYPLQPLRQIVSQFLGLWGTP